MTALLPAFAPSEIRTDEPTRSARLKWVIVLNSAAPAGQQVNAAACMAAATGSAVVGILGPAGRSADEIELPGLPWAGCSILAATPEQLAGLAQKAWGSEGMFVAGM